MKYTNISVKRGFADAIQKFIDANPQFGYSSISQFMADASREKLEGLGVIVAKEAQMEHFNLDEKGVKILDRNIGEKGAIVEVFFHPNGIRCSYHETDSCQHITFAMTQPDVQKIIRKKRKEGWKLPEL